MKIAVEGLLSFVELLYFWKNLGPLRKLLLYRINSFIALLHVARVGFGETNLE
jgi:hypothetical protein